MNGNHAIDTATTTMLPHPDQLNRVYRCAWCRSDGPVAGGLPYYVYHADGSREAADPHAWSGSDGICPRHSAKLRTRLRLRVLAA